MSTGHPWPLVITGFVIAALLYFSWTSFRRNALRFAQVLWRFGPNHVVGLVDFITQLGKSRESTKDTLLTPLARFLYLRLHLTPNAQTILRGLLVGIGLLMVPLGFYWPPLFLSTFPWILDATDGLTAKLYPKSKTKWGALYDPCTDNLLMIVTGFVLASRFEWPIVPYIFASILAGRGILWLSRIIWNQKKIRTGEMNVMMPATDEGRLKTFFVVVAFGAQLLNPGEWHWLWDWPSFLLGMAILLELRSIIRQFYRHFTGVTTPAIAPSIDSQNSVDGQKTG